MKNINSKSVLLMPMILVAVISFFPEQQDSNLQALGHYVGTWDCKFESESTVDGTRSETFTGVVEAKWVLGNKFIEQTGEYTLGDSSQSLTIKTMMSFEEQKNQYRNDYFISSGEVTQSIGKWDDKTKTMTSIRKEDSGNTTTIVADFSTPDVERWTIETQDVIGKRLSKILGTNTRRKKD